MMKSKKIIGGYCTNSEKTAIMSMYTEVEGEAPVNFIASENLNDKVLRISADKKSIEVVERKVPTTALLLERKQRTVRAKRNALIAETDYLMQPDYPITAEQLEQLKAYRQQLRDITELHSFAEKGEVVFPEKFQQ